MTLMPLAGPHPALALQALPALAAAALSLAADPDAAVAAAFVAAWPAVEAGGTQPPHSSSRCKKGSKGMSAMWERVCNVPGGGAQLLPRSGWTRTAALGLKRTQHSQPAPTATCGVAGMGMVERRKHRNTCTPTHTCSHCEHGYLSAHWQFMTNMARNWFSNLSCCWQSMQSVVKHSGHDRMASERCDLREEARRR